MIGRVFGPAVTQGYKPHWLNKSIEEMEKLPINGESRAMEQSLIIRWARLDFKLDGWVVPSYTMNGRMYAYIIDYSLNLDITEDEDNRDFISYERAQVALVKHLIKLIKKIKNG